MTEFQTLRPGLLVSMFTSVEGNVSYHGIDRDVQRLDRTEVTDIHTRKTVSDVEEQERAIKQRTKIRGLILSVCVSTAFKGTLLCPNDVVQVKDADGNVTEVRRQQLLREAIAEGHRLADEFNAKARTTHIEFYCYCGIIAQDDVETMRAITGTIRQLIDDMQEGLKALDPKAIREAANKAAEAGKMLTPEAGSRLELAIKASREAASKIVKAGNEAAKEVDRQTIRKVKQARTAFLDVNTDVSKVAVVKPKQSGRNIDLDVPARRKAV
jgi:hypothetical protein